MNHLNQTDSFNYKALELLKDTAVLTQRKEIDELVLIVSAEDNSIAQVMTDSAAGTLVRLLMLVVASTEQLGALLLKDPENLVLLKREVKKLQQLLAKIGVS